MEGERKRLGKRARARGGRARGQVKGQVWSPGILEGQGSGRRPPRAVPRRRVALRQRREDNQGRRRSAAVVRSFGGFGKGVGEILWKAANVLQNKLTRAQYLDEVTWTTKNWLGLQKQRISVVLHTAIAEQIVNELASGEGGRVHGAKCLAVLAGVA